MKNRLAKGERRGGVVWVPRGWVAAVVPLAIPLILAAARSGEAPQASELFAPTAAALPRIDFRVLLPAELAPLPPHSVYFTIDKGDTLDSVFTAGGLPARQSALLAREFSRTVDPRRLRIGDLVRFHYDEAGGVDAVEMKVTGWGELRSVREQGRFHVTTAEAPTRTVEHTVSATIETSLYEAIRATGEGAELAQDLAAVFQWDIDFFSLQKGDRFSMVVASQYSGEDRLGYGPILAARFEHNSRTYEAYRHEDAGGIPGYFTATGTPVKKQFLKAPLEYSRITSSFSRRRFHPVLQRFRPHWGIDYGAPIGTPVMSTADGVVVFAGYEVGEGNFVRIRHNSRIETSYLHLSRFAKGIRKGTRIEQGEVIGYVGATGVVTGPHLDYRVRDGGKWLNPLELKSIAPDPLRGASLRGFRGQAARLSARITRPATLVAGQTLGVRALF